MSYYIAGEDSPVTTWSNGGGTLTVIGGKTTRVECLILTEWGDSAVVGLDDWAPLIAVLENPPKDYPQQVGPPLNGMYLTVQFMRAIGKLRLQDEVCISVCRKDGTDTWSLGLGIEYVDTLIRLLTGPGPMTAL